MFTEISSRYALALRDQINIRKAPFSHRGSRLVIMETPVGDALYIKLAERLTDIEPGLGTHLRRRPFIEHLVPVDSAGNTLEYETETYPHVIYLRTRIGVFGIAFRDRYTVCVGIPEAGGGISFLVRTQVTHADDRGCDFRAIRDFAYVANRPLALNRVSVRDDAHEVVCVSGGGEDSTVTLEFASAAECADDGSSGAAADGTGAAGLDGSPSRGTICRRAYSFSGAVSASEQLWHRWFEAAPRVSERWQSKYLYAWWVMGNNLVSPKGVVRYEAMMPSKSHYIGIWQWDAFFHALAFRHVDCALAENQFRSMFACQQSDGMVPDAIWDEGVVTEIDHPVQGIVTKPPIAAWAAWKVYQTGRNEGFLREMYGPLVRLMNWWFGMNDAGSSGLAEYSHPYSSGLDDSPLWDAGMPVKSPDLNTYLCLGSQALAEIAGVLGRAQDAAMWRAKALALVDRMIEDLYDEDDGLFWATKNGTRISVDTPFNYFPLFTGLLPRAVAEKLVMRLKDPELYWSRYPLPTVALNDPSHDPATMWRGPVWINVNALFVDGLLRAGYGDLAAELRTRTLELVASQPGIYEYYHPQTGEPPATTAFAFGWSAACFIDLAIQDSQKN